MSIKGIPTLDPVIGTPTVTAPCRQALQITIPGAAIDAAIASAERRYLANVKIPGFRPGKAPIATIKKRFSERILEEVRQELVSQSLRTALESEAVAPITMPELVDQENLVVTPGKDLAFSVEYDVAPEFELPEYKGIPLTRRVLEVTDERVENYIAGFREQRATMAPVERAAESGDVLRVSYTSVLPGDDEVPAAAERLLNATEQWLMIGNQEPIPGIGAALIGKSADDVVSVDVTFPEDYQEPFLVGKQAAYTVTIQQVNSYVTPELDDEFAKGLGLESADALREAVRERLAGEVADMQRQGLQAQVFEYITGKMDFELPPQVLVREQASALNDLNRRHHEQHNHAEGEECTHGEDLKEEADTLAVNRLRFQFTMQKIAEVEGITVEAQEVHQRMEAFRQSRKLTIQKMQQEFNLEAMANMIEWDILRERTIDHLTTLATITETVVEDEDSAEGDTASDAPGETPADDAKTD